MISVPLGIRASGYRPNVPDIALQIEVDTRELADGVQQRVQRALGARGSIHVGSAAESLPDHHRGPGHLVTAVIVCDEPAATAIADVRTALPDFDVEQVEATTGADAQLMLRKL